jgi:Zn-dependent peptidase ImmA (M78 family)
VSAAEALLLSLGIVDPKDLDLEAIAWCQGAEVRYATLASCEARIIGYGNRAIITVDPSHGSARTRYSIGHELGHWAHHRGSSSICRSDEIGAHTPKNGSERIADGYAADLLMPSYLFKPAALRLKKVTFSAVTELANLFQTSRTATALRLVGVGPEPAMLICHGPEGRKWFNRGPDVPERWFPRDELDAESNALDVLHGGASQRLPMLIGADAWFDRRAAERYEVYEQTVRVAGGDVLTLLTFKSPEMLE